MTPAGVAVMFAIAAVSFVFGVVTVVSSMQQSPAVGTAARVFATDPSCIGDLSQPAVPGACRTLDGAVEQTITFVRSRGGPDRVAILEVGSGTRRVHLSGHDAAPFVKNIRPGAAARIQMFDETVARVSAGGLTVETTAAPDVVASKSRYAGVLGGVTAVLGVLFAFMGVRMLGQLGSA